MEILTPYSDDTLQLISDGDTYSFSEYIPWTQADYNLAVQQTTAGNYNIDYPLIHPGTAPPYPDVNAIGTPNPNATILHIYKLSVFSTAGAFLRSQDLTQDLGIPGQVPDFYISNNQLFLKPNEYLDREGFGEGN